MQLKKFYLPLGFLVAFITLAIIWIGLDLPRDEELVAVLTPYFEKYGLWFLLASAVLEGVLLVGVYYPGSFVIFFGVILAGKDIGQVALVLLVVTLGMIFGYMLNFALGKYGWYRLLLRFGLGEPIERAKERLTKYGSRAIIGSYWHPNFAALTATAAGILDYPFMRFLVYSLGSAIVWNTLWGALTYILGHKALELMGIRFILVFIGVWILIIAISSFFQKENKV